MSQQLNYFQKRTCSLALLFCFVFVSSVKSESFLIINKIMYDTPLNEQIATGAAYSNGEYVELYNAGIQDVNLNGWALHGGGNTELYYFPPNTVMAPKTYLIVAYQYYNSGFALNQLFDGLYATTDHQIQYQRKIILANSGEPVYLRDNYGSTRDSIYYDGTSSKTKPNRLSADNADGLAGNSCVCLQRVTAIFASNGCAITNNAEWVTATAHPFHQVVSFLPPILPGVGISYGYDLAGNRISRKLVTLGNGASLLKSQNFMDKGIPEPAKERLGDLMVSIYPNPTKGALQIGISGKILDKITITLYSMQGNVLQSKIVDSNITVFEMDSYPNGVYIMRAVSDGKATDFKVIKE